VCEAVVEFLKSQISWVALEGVATLVGAIATSLAAFFAYIAAREAARSANATNESTRTSVRMAVDKLWISLLADDQNFFTHLEGRTMFSELTNAEKRKRNVTIVGKIQVEDMLLDINDPRSSKSADQAFGRRLDFHLIFLNIETFISHARNGDVKDTLRKIESNQVEWLNHREKELLEKGLKEEEAKEKAADFDIRSGIFA
jgi:hypothetical protein